MSLPSSDDEIRKAITALAIDGARVVIFDNVRTVESAALEHAITATRRRDRILGMSRTVNLPQRMTFALTGNNVDLRGDLARRAILIRLDAREERPWERRGFKHPHLLAAVRAQRQIQVEAVITLVHAWIDSGCPKPAHAPSFGSFEAWVDVVGGILDRVGVGGFLGNLHDLWGRNDESDDWHEALKRIHDRYLSSEWKPMLLAQHILAEREPGNHDDRTIGGVLAFLPESVTAAAERSPRALAISLGSALKGVCGRVFGEYRLLSRNSGGNTYTVTKTGPTPGVRPQESGGK